MARKPARIRLLWAILSLVLRATFGHTTACRSPALTFSAMIPFAMKLEAPCSAVLRHFPLVLGCSHPLVGVDTEISEVVHETPHPLFFLSPTQPAPPTPFPNITHFGGLVSSMRATNPANKIRLLRIVTSMLSLSVLTNMSI